MVDEANAEALQPHMLPTPTLTPNLTPTSKPLPGNDLNTPPHRGTASFAPPRLYPHQAYGWPRHNPHSGNARANPDDQSYDPEPHPRGLRLGEGLELGLGAGGVPADSSGYTGSYPSQSYPSDWDGGKHTDGDRDKERNRDSDLMREREAEVVRDGFLVNVPQPHHQSPNFNDHPYLNPYPNLYAYSDPYSEPYPDRYLDPSTEPCTNEGPGSDIRAEHDPNPNHNRNINLNPDLSTQHPLMDCSWNPNPTEQPYTNPQPHTNPQPQLPVPTKRLRGGAGEDGWGSSTSSEFRAEGEAGLAWYDPGDTSTLLQPAMGDGDRDVDLEQGQKDEGRVGGVEGEHGREEGPFVFMYSQGNKHYYKHPVVVALDDSLGDIKSNILDRQRSEPS